MTPAETSTRWRRALALVLPAALLAAVPLAPAEAGLLQAPIARLIGVPAGGPQSLALGPAGAPAPALAPPSAAHPSSTPVPEGPAEAGIVPVLPDGRIVCWVEVDTTLAAPDEWPTRFPGVETAERVGTAVQARVPAAFVRALSDLPGVEYVGLPPRAFPLQIDSQGLAGMRAPTYWSAFEDGRDVRIGIIDTGFDGYQRLLGTELPASVRVKSFYLGADGDGDITGGGEPHGTACAEIVHDVAPGAELYLANVYSPADLDRAIAWMVDSGVEVISHSVGWFIGIGDGRGTIQDLVHRATSEGIVWVNASGNFALGHWSGLFADTDNDTRIEFRADGDSPEDLPLPRPPYGTTVSGVLIWDRPDSDPDLSFEIDVVSASGAVLASSETDWAGYPEPWRPIAAQIASGDLDGLALRVRITQGNGEGAHLRVIRTDYGLFPPADRKASGSIVSPADSPEVLTVGAFRWDQQIVEAYSSYGPTLAGVQKPEIVGPDGVTTAVYGSDFSGTSAACPHVAGAVGLLLSSSISGGLFDARFSPNDILLMLRDQAESMSGGGSEEIQYGWGKVRLPVTHLSAEEQGGPRLLAMTGIGGSGLQLRLLDGPPRPAPLQVFDVTGRLLGTVAVMEQSRQYTDYRPDGLARILRARGRYWALEPRSGARVGFYWPGR